MMRNAWMLAAAIGLIACLPGNARLTAQEDEDKQEKVSLTVRATPAISFSPARIRASAELKGGPDDAEKFYCATVEWDWGDLTKSEEAADCEPYEPGVSQVTRRFISEHTYHMGGRYRIQIRLKRNNKVLASANTTITVRPGLRDMSYD
ncbi:MAG TPA: hypothetical protein VIL35_02920 [Vicinamibacterales bacterium]